MMEKTYDTIATRLAQILNKLNSGERLNVEELANEFGVTARTIQRDLNERLSYLPLKKEMGLYFLEEYYLGKLNFNDIKNFAVLSGIQELYPSLDKSFLTKILDSSIQDAYVIKGHNYEDVTALQHYFELLEEAIVEQKKVTFLYKEKQRVVEAYKLVNAKGIWYLAGVEESRIKTFSLKKIHSLQKSSESFLVDEAIIKKINNNETLWFSNTEIEVIVKVKSDVAGYFKRRNIFPNQQIVKELSNKDLLVSTKVAFEEEILKLVRYWIPNIEIISPESLRKKLYFQLEEYLKC